MRTLDRLTLSAFGMHLADQVSLVSVPLVSVLVFGASADIIGLLVAAQSGAHLLGSLPSGLVVDRMHSRSVAIIATLVSTISFAAAALSIHLYNLPWFGISVTLGGFGIVLFVLVCLSILPRITDVNQLARANARIELPRALCSFAVPLLIGIMISTATAGWMFVVAAMGGLMAFATALNLPKLAPEMTNQDGIGQRIAEGARFVLKNKLLLPIAICSVFWNLAFSVLLVLMVPLIVDELSLNPGSFGVALSAFGLAAILGAWAAGRLSNWVPPNVILVFGPGSSLLASSVLLCVPTGGSAATIYLSFFILGFGPSMWLVAQNSIRQLVTPAELLGRVNSVIQTAIYGVRPLGALFGGFAVSATSPRAGLILVVACFAASLAAALFSRLKNVKRYADLAAAPMK